MSRFRSLTRKRKGPSARTKQRLLLERLENRVLLAAQPLPAEERTLFAEGTEALADFGSQIGGTALLAASVPLASQTIGELADVGGVLETRITQPVNDYLESVGEPSTDGLLDTLEQSLGSTATVELIEDEMQAVFDIRFVTQESVAIELDLESELQLAPVQVDSPLTISGTVALTLDMQFGIRRDDGAGDTFFVSFSDDVVEGQAANRIVATVNTTDSPSLMAQLGLLGLTVEQAMVDFNVDVALVPDPGAELDIDGLRRTSPDEVISMTAAGENGFALTFDVATAPIGGELGFAPLPAGTQFIVTDSDLYDDRFDVADPAYAMHNATAQTPFTEVTAPALFDALGQLEMLLSDLRNSPALQREIPLTGGQTLADIIDLGTAFNSQVSGRAGDDTPEGGPSFASVQELVEQLQGSATYVEESAGGPALLLDISFLHTFDAAEFELEFDFDLGDLNGIDANSPLRVEAEVAADFQLGLVLERPGSGFTITDDMTLRELNRGMEFQTSDGEGDLRVTIANGAVFEVDLSGLRGESTVANLINVVHGAAASAGVVTPGFPGELQFEMKVEDDPELDDDAQGFTLVDHTTGASEFRVERVGDSLAAINLGIAGQGEEGRLQGKPLHGESLADKLFLVQKEDTPMIRATGRLLAEDIDASASLGFVAVEIGNGDSDTAPAATGVGQLEAALSLTDPGTDAFDERVGVVEAYQALSEAALRLTAPEPVDFPSSSTDSFSGSLRFQLQESDGTVTEFDAAFLVPHVSSETDGESNDRLAPIVDSLMTSLATGPLADRVQVGNSGDRVTFTLLEGEARRLTVAPIGDLTATTRLGIGEPLSAYIVRPKLSGSANFDLPLAVSVGGPATPGALNVAGLTVPQLPSIKVTIPDFSRDDLSSSDAVTADLSGLGDLFDLRKVSLSTVVSALQGGLEYLRQLEGLSELEFLNQDLPLIDVNLNELLSIADSFGDLLIRLDNDPASGLGDLDELLEDLLGKPESSNGNTDLPDFPVFLIPELNAGKTFDEGARTVDLADSAAFEDDPVSGFDSLEEYLRSLQGDDPSIEISFDKDGDDVALRIDLSQSIEVLNVEAPVSVDLSTVGLSGLSDFIDTTGETLLQLDAGATLNLAFGLDLTDPSDVRPFLYDLVEDGTRIDLAVRALASEIQFTATAGPLGAAVTDGSVGLTDTADPDLPAIFTIGLVDNDSNGRHYLTEFTGDGAGIGQQDLATSAVGKAEAILPIAFPGLDVAVPGLGPKLLSEPEDVIATVDDLLDFSDIEIVGGNRFEAARDVLAGDFNLLAMVGGWEGAFDLLIDAMNGQLFGQPLPLIGDALKEEARFLEEMKQSVSENLQAVEDQVASDIDRSLEEVRRALFDALGPGGLDMLVDERSALAPDDPLQRDGAVTTHDIVIEDDPQSELGKVFRLHLGRDPLELDLPVDFDLGIPGLQLDVNAPVNVALGFDFVLGLGVNIEQGFFLEASDPSELEVFLDVTVPGLDASGELGFLRVDATDRPTARVVIGEQGLLPSQFVLVANEAGETTTLADDTVVPLSGVTVEFVDDPDLVAGVEETVTFDQDNRKIVYTLNAASTTAGRLVEVTNVAGNGVSEFFHAELPFSGSGLGLVDVGQVSETVAELPSRFVGKFEVDIVDPGGDDARVSLSEMFGVESVGDILDVSAEAKADVDLHIVAGFGPLANFPSIRTDLAVDWEYSLAEGAADPLVRFENVEMNLGEFLTNFAGSSLEKVEEVIDPVRPILDTLNSRVPVISELAGADLTFLDLGRLYGGRVGKAVQFIDAVGEIVSIVDSIPELEPNTWISFGDANFDFGTNSVAPALSSEDLKNAARDGLVQATAEFAGFDPDDFLASPGEVDAETGMVLSYPILSEPSRVFEMLSGQDVEVFTLELPRLEYDTTLSLFFPIPPFPILGAEIAGRVGATIDLAFGYDTFGVRQYLATGNVADVFNGFFLFDHENADGSGADVDEVVFDASLTAAAALRTGIVNASVGGGIFGHVDFNLHDNNEDGKVRAVELLDNLLLGGIHVFDVDGAVDAKLFAKAEINLLITTIEEQFDIASVELLSFEFPRPGGEFVQLAQMNGTTLELNIGPDAGRRKNLFTDDVAEDYFIRPGQSDGTVFVEAFGRSQIYENVARITGNAGAGDDTINVHPDLAIPVFLSGGPGNDLLVGGSANDQLSGGAGNDELRGEMGADILIGGDGRDLIWGGDGDDQLDGGAGIDQLEGGDGNDVLDGGADSDRIAGGAGDDLLIGADGDDELLGDSGADSIQGGAGRDLLRGGGDSDLLEGGDDDDRIFGDSGSDVIFAGPGLDVVVGGIGNDEIHGEEGDDRLSGGNSRDLIVGGPGNDLIEGGLASDELFGGAGNDLIFANAQQPDEDEPEDADAVHTIYGGGGADTVHAGDAEDTVYGDGQDSPLSTTVTGADGDDVVHAYGGNDRVFGGGGADRLLGDTGNDFLVGGLGDDELFGAAGDDVLIGGPVGTLTPEDFDRSTPELILANFTYPPEFELRNALLAELGAGAEAFAYTPSNMITPRVLAGGNTVDTAGDGRDLLDGDLGIDILLGGSDSDILSGGPQDDYLDAGAGNDRDVRGDAGDDVVRGGGNNDQVRGGTGIDQVYGDAGDDLVYGDEGVVTSNGMSLAGQRLFGGAGDDSLFAYAASSADAVENPLAGDQLFGGAGGDSLHGNIRSEILVGDAGNDLIRGDNLRGPQFVANSAADTRGGADTLLGSGGEDQLLGGGGDDALWGGTGTDLIEGQSGSDRQYGGSGIDLFVLYTEVDAGADAIDGHFGNQPGDEGDPLAAPDDNATDILVVTGSDADNTILLAQSTAANFEGQLHIDYDRQPILVDWLSETGEPLFEQIQVAGLGGDDKIGFAQADPLPGLDSFMLPAGTEELDLTDLIGRSRDFVGVFDGNDGDDLLAGSAGRDRLDGGRGSDALFGLEGDDRLWGDGGEGANGDFDRLFSGGGNDDLIGGQGRNELYAWSFDPLAVRPLTDPLPLGFLAGQSADRAGAVARLTGRPLSGNGVLQEDATLPLSIDGGEFVPVTVLASATNGRDTNSSLSDLVDDLNDALLSTFNLGFRESQSDFSRPPNDQLRAAFPPPANGVLGRDVTFVLDIGVRDTVVLRAADTNGETPGTEPNQSVEDLIEDINRALAETKHNPATRALLKDGRITFDGPGQRKSIESPLPIRAELVDGNRISLVGDVDSIVLRTFDPQFGVFVGAEGELRTHNGDLDGDGQLDGDGSQPPFVQEDTGLNRMVGSIFDDVLAGGTGLDFLYGNGGKDTLLRSDGSTFESLDGGLAGDEWKEYARSTGQVWYVPATNANDQISVDFVTEPGLLADHHLITRLTDNNGQFSFDAQVRLDFAAVDDEGTPLWDPQDTVIDFEELRAAEDAVARGDALADIEPARIDLVNGLLPPEGEFLAIVIDGLDGDDEITVGPTVQKTVWIDAGAGDDFVRIRSGNRILVDRGEIGEPDGKFRGRNDIPEQAFLLPQSASPEGVTYTSLTLDSASDVDWYRLTLAGSLVGSALRVATGSAADEVTLALFALDNVEGPLAESTGVEGRAVLPLDSIETDRQYLLRVSSNLTPTIYDLQIDRGGLAGDTLDMGLRSDEIRRDVILGGAGNDILIGGPGEDWVFGEAGADVISGGVDQQQSDLLFGGPGDDSFQLIPDELPKLANRPDTLFQPATQTFVPTQSDRFLGGDGDDQVLFLGGDRDRDGRAVSDFVALRYNTGLHRYEFTSLVWDRARQRFVIVPSADGNSFFYQQHYAFYQTDAVERTVIATQDGDDVVHADGRFRFLPVEALSDPFDPEAFEAWGIDLGDFEQGAREASLEIQGGDGNDQLFGGALNDTIQGGAGNDLIFGGSGNDQLDGGGGSDDLFGLFDEATFATLTMPAGGIAGADFAPFEFPPAPPFLVMPTGRAGIEIADGEQLSLGDTAALFGSADDADLGSVVPVGDFNADGHQDHAVVGRDQTFIVFGPLALDRTVDVAEVAHVVVEHSALGRPMSRAGDVNGDGINDLAFVRQTFSEAIVTVVFGGQTGRQGDGFEAIQWPRFWDSEFQAGFLDDDPLNGNSRVFRLNNSQLSTSHTTLQFLEYDRDEYDDLLISTVRAEGAGTFSDFAPLDVADVSSGTEFDGSYFFIAEGTNEDDPDTDRLWRITDGQLQEILMPEVSGSPLTPRAPLVSLSDGLYLAAVTSTSDDYMVRIGDATAAPEAKIVDTAFATQQPSIIEIFPLGDELLYTQWGPALGNDSVNRVFDFDSGQSRAGIDPAPANPVVDGNRLYFRVFAGIGTGNAALWTSEIDAGTIANTRSVDAVNAIGPFDSGLGTNDTPNPRELTPLNGLLYFVGLDDVHGEELWEYDPVSDSVRIVDLLPGPTSSSPTELTAFDGAIYFSAIAGPAGRELWSYRPESGAQLAADINPSGGSSPADMLTVDDGLYFTAFNGQRDALFRFDGEQAAQITADGRPELRFGHQGSLYFRDEIRRFDDRFDSIIDQTVLRRFGSPSVFGYVIGGAEIVAGVETRADGSYEVANALGTIVTDEAGLASDDATILVAGDVNRDGREDFVFANSQIRAVLPAGILGSQLKVGAGVLPEVRFQGLSLGSTFGATSVGDIDRDGHADIGFFERGDLWIYPGGTNLTAASLDPANAMLHLESAPRAFHSATAGDFNGDGQVDLAVDVGSRRVESSTDFSQTYVFLGVASRGSELRLAAADVVLDASTEASPLGRALLLDGSAGVAARHSDTLDLTRRVTVEAWFRVDDFADGAAWSPIVEKASGTDITYSVRTGPAGSVQLSTSDRDGVQTLESPLFRVGRQEWYHVAGVFDRFSARMEIYLNGERVATGDLRRGSSASHGGSLLIGTTSESDSTVAPLIGAVDEVRIWDEARTGHDIRAHMFNRISGDERGLAAQFSLDQLSTGDVFRDSSPNANHADWLGDAAPEFLEISQLTSQLISGLIDLDGDGIDELLLGASAAEGGQSPASVAAGQIYVVQGAGTGLLPTVADDVEDLANFSVPGSGAFLVDRGTGRAESFTRRMAAGQSEQWFRFETLGDSAPADSLRVQSVGTQFVAELLRADGSLVQSGRSIVSLRNVPAGVYFLRVHTPDGTPVTVEQEFRIMIDAPVRGASHETSTVPDRDTLRGQDGDDLLVGNPDIDHLIGGSGADSFVGELIEIHDFSIGDRSSESPIVEEISLETIQPPQISAITFQDADLGQAIADELGLPSTLPYQALRFDGQDDYVDLSTDPFFFESEFARPVGDELIGVSGVTMVAWINNESLPEEGEHNFIFGTRNNPGRAGAELVLFGNTEGRHSLRIGGRSAPSDGYKFKEFPFESIGEWHHVVAVLDYEGDDIRLFIDGVQQLSTINESADTNFDLESYDLGDPTPNEPDSIGRSPSGGHAFHGLIDELAIYARPFEVEDVTTVLGNGVDPDDVWLTVYYPFDEPAGALARETTGGSDGRLGGGNFEEAPQRSTNAAPHAVASGTDNVVGFRSLQFDGVDDVVMLEEGSVLGTLTNNFTVSAWASPEFLDSEDFTPVIGALGSELGDDVGGWAFGFLRRGLALVVDRGIGGEREFVARTLDVPLATGVWHHIAVTVDSENRVEFHLNGQPALTGKIDIDGPIGTTTAPFRIGYAPTRGTHLFDGHLDEVAVWSRELFQNELRSLASGGPVGSANLIGHWKFNEASGTEVIDETGNTKGQLGHRGQSLYQDSWSAAAGMRRFGDRPLIFRSVPAEYALAREVSSIPTRNTRLGRTLTFDAADTGLARSFQISTLSEPGRVGPNYGFRYVESGSRRFLNIDSGTTEDDDFEIRILDGPPLYAIQFEVAGNQDLVGESIIVYGENDVVLDDISIFPGVPPTSTDRRMGIVSEKPITRIVFDEDAEGDAIGLGEIAFGVLESFEDTFPGRSYRTRRDDPFDDVPATRVIGEFDSAELTTIVSLDASGRGIQDLSGVASDFSEQLWSVDFQGAQQGGTFGHALPVTYQGVEPLFGHGNVWNAFEVNTHGVGELVANPTMPLVDSLGRGSEVSLSVFGNVLAVNPSPDSSIHSADPLLNDYLFFNAAGASPVVDLTFSGLVPGEQYELFVYGPAAIDVQPNRAFELTVDTDGDGSVNGEATEIIGTPGLKFSGVVASALGRITLRASGDDEGNIAGVQLRSTGAQGIGELLPNLDSLDLHDNDISDLGPLSSAGQLRDLNLSNNLSLTDISDLASITSLTHLDLRQTLVDPVSLQTENTLAELKQLEVLHLPLDPNVLSADQDLAVQEGGVVEFTLGSSQAAPATWLVLDPRGAPIPEAGGVGPDFRFTPPDEGVYTVQRTIDSSGNAAPVDLFPLVVTNVAPRIDELQALPARDEGAVVSPQTLISEAGLAANLSDPGNTDAAITVIEVLDADGRPVDRTESALAFDGNDFVDLGPVEDIGTSGLTIEAWYRKDSASSELMTLVGGTQGGDLGYALSISGGRLALQVSSGPGFHAVAIPEPELGVWHHVVGVMDRANSEIRLYLNPSSASDQPAAARPASPNTDIPATLGLGARVRSDGSATAYFDGLLSEVRIWGEPRAIADIVANRDENLLPGTPDLEGYWTFDEAGGSFAIDRSGNERDGLLGGGQQSHAPSFVGIGDFILGDEGDFEVSFTVSDGDGGFAQRSSHLTVENVTPTAVISPAGSIVTVGEPLRFDGSSSFDPGLMDELQYEWNVTTSTGQDIAASVSDEFTFVPQYPGHYLVALRVTDPAGAQSLAETLVIAEPEVVVSAPLEPYIESAPLVFDAFGTSAPSAFATRSFAWNVTNPAGGVVTSAGASLRYLPVDDGTHTVTLEITDTFADSTQVSQSAELSFEVLNVAPVLSAPGDFQAKEGFVEFALEVSDPGREDDLRLSVEWGDGSESLVQQLGPGDHEVTIRHAYVERGTYRVNISLGDGDDIVGHFLFVTIDNRAPDVSIVPVADVVPDGSSIQLAGGVDDLGGDILTAFWDFGDGTTSEVFTPSEITPFETTHTYRDSGVYTVTLVVDDDEGGRSLAEQIVEVQNQDPTQLVLEGPDASPVGESVRFSGSVADHLHDELRGTLDFGDGASTPALMRRTGDGLFEFAAEHVYSVEGEVEVMLTVRDREGGESTVRRMVTVGAPESLFVVTELTSGESGFSVTLNGQLETSVLDLVPGLTPADVTLRGAVVGDVVGSVIITESLDAFTFIKSGGPLLPDTYTVTLRSADDGVRTTGGSRLDGNGDGTPGDDFVQSFVVGDVAGGSTVVGIPDFVRGPGQPVNLPANADGIPVALTNTSGVRGVVFDVHYDPALLSVTGATLADGLPIGTTVSVDTTTVGRARVSFLSLGELPAGPRPIVNLQAEVPTANANAIYGRKQLIDIRDISITDFLLRPLAARADDALHVVQFPGDVSGNGRLNAADASRVARVAARLENTFADSELVDAIVLGDVSGNGRLNSFDASLVARAGAQLPVDEIPAIPAGVVTLPSRLGPDPRLSLSRTVVAKPGDSIAVPVQIDSIVNLQAPNRLIGTELVVDFDPRQLTATAVTPGEFIQARPDWGLYPSIDNSLGRIVILAFGAFPVAGEFSEELLNIHFAVANNAQPGPTPVNLMADAGGVQTELLDEGDLNLELDGPVTNDSDDPVDGLITIQAIDEVFRRLGR